MTAMLRADDLFSKIVRLRPACERCGVAGALQCAHIVRRRFGATRCDETNAWALCDDCHRYLDNNRQALDAFAIYKMGTDAYQALRRKAHGTTKAGEAFWITECARLRARLKELSHAQAS